MEKMYYHWKCPSHSRFENAMEGEIPTGAEGWLHGAAILVTMCFKSRFECPCMIHCRSCVEEEQEKPLLSRNHYCPHSDEERTLRGTWCNGWEAGLKTFRQQVGIQGQENRKIPLLCNMVITWTTYYGEDFTRIVLELIGALEQRIVVDAELGYQPSSIPKVNALRFTLVMKRKHEG